MVSALPDRVRAACAEVSARPGQVRIDEGRIDAYAARLPESAEVPGLDSETHFAEGSREDVAAFVLCNDAINFGSGWWPTIRKRPGLSGYSTMEAGVAERFDSTGPWTADELVTMNASEIAAVVGQDPEHPLMAQFAAALRDVGAHLIDEYDGRYLGVVESAKSIPDLAAVFAGWDSFSDISRYDGRDVPFFKRAQLAAADLHRAGVADLPGLEHLTAFADNLVPHVLRIDGVLVFDPALVARIDAEQLIEHDSPEEVEIRACAVHAVDLLVAAHGATTATAVDNALWHRGGEPRYKARPRHRAPCTAY